MARVREQGLFSHSSLLRFGEMAAQARMIHWFITSISLEVESIDAVRA